MRIRDWSSDVCSSDLPVSAIAIDGKPLAKGAWSNPEGRMTIALGKTVPAGGKVSARITYAGTPHVAVRAPWDGGFVWAKTPGGQPWVATAVQMEGCDMRSEEHTSELQSLMRISYAVFCLKKKNKTTQQKHH